MPPAPPREPQPFYRIAARAETVKLVGDKYFGGLTDIRTGSSLKMYFSSTTHFADGHILRSIDFACEPFNFSHTRVNIARMLKTVLIAKVIDPKKCTGITVDNVASMIKGGEIRSADDDNNVVTAFCFCHPLQPAVHHFQGVANVTGSHHSTGVFGGAGAVGNGGIGGPPGGANGGGARSAGGSGGTDAAGGGNVGSSGSHGSHGSGDIGGDTAGGSSSGGLSGFGDGGAGGAGSRLPASDYFRVKPVLTLHNKIVTAFNRSYKFSMLCRCHTFAIYCPEVWS